MQHYVALFIVFIIQTSAQDLPSGLNNKPSDIFPNDYDSFVPPSDNGQPAHIYITLSLMDIDNVDEENMEFNVQLYMYEQWKDERINLQLYSQKPITLKTFPPRIQKYFWVPDLVFENVKNGQVFQLSLPNAGIRFTDDGHLVRYTRYNFVISCPMDFHFYPMDTQLCHFTISTFSNDDHTVLLHWSDELYPESEGIKLQYKDIQPLKYELQGIQSYKECEVWPDGNYTYLYANFTFVRRISGAIFNVYVPSTLVVILSWISFWVDVEAVPARITLGVTSLLTLATQIQSAHYGLPQISYLTAMDIWLLVCLLTVFSVLLEFAFAYHYSVKAIHAERSILDEKCHKDDTKSLKSGKHLLRSRTSQSIISANSNVQKLQKLLELKYGSRSKFLDRMSRVIFPVSFLIFGTVYWIYFLHFKVNNFT